MPEKRFMEAVAEKIGGKRRPMLKRKGGPTVVIALGAPKMAPKPEPEMEDEDEGGDMCECPECGHKFRTPGASEGESGDEYESEDEEEDEGEDEDEK